VLERLPVVSALLPAIEAAHQGLLRSRPAPPTGSGDELAAILEKQARLDALHDRKMRGAIALLDALADIADDAQDAERYRALRDHLCPDGIEGTAKSYAEEAGAARLLPGRLDESDGKLLQKIAIPGGKLADVVEAWTDAAEVLGALEAKKEGLSRQPEAGQGRADVVRAKQQWIRVARALETNILLSGAAEEAMNAILGPLYEAEVKADRRGAADQEG
jgi:hypothetical protein